MPPVNLQHPWAKRLMLSTRVKAATYGADVVVSAANFQLMNGYLGAPAAEDQVDTDDSEHSGSELPTLQEITEFRTKFPYSEPKGSPNGIAALGALAFGDLTSTQELALTSYEHYIKALAPGTSLADINLIYDPANRQDKFVGVKGNTFKLTSEENGYIALESELISSGELTESAETFQASVSEIWLKARDTKVYIKTAPNPASDIIAAGSLSQDTDNISAAQNLVSIGDVVESWSFEMNNNAVEIPGHGGQGYLQDIDFGKRTYTLSMKLKYKDETVRDYFTDQTNLAVEFNCKATSGGVIAATGANYYGLILRIPLCRLNVRPDPQEGPTDANYSNELEFTVIDDGTNPFADLTVYNAIADYLQ